MLAGSLILWLGVAAAAPAPDVREPADVVFDSFLFQTLPDEAVPEGHCLTPLVHQVREQWSAFSPAQQAELSSFLSPMKPSFDAALMSEAPPPPGGGATCFGQVGANEVVGEHFTVQWDSGISQEQAEDLLDALEHSYETLIDELGWYEPIGMSEYNMLAFVADNSGYSGAYTTVESCPGHGAAPYMVVYSGVFGSLWYQDVAGHEFNHASQFAYDITSFDLWWWEATATWVEEYIYWTHNAWSQHLYGYSSAPELAMHASSQQDQATFWHMYGMAIWAFYLDEYVGGHDLVQDTWELVAEGFPGSYDMPTILEGVGVDFDEVYPGFLAANTVMDYREQGDFWPVELFDELEELPFDGTSNTWSQPAGLGQNFIRIDASLADGRNLALHFDGDDAVGWFAVLVTTADDAVVEYVTATKADDGQLYAEIAWDGAGDAYLVASPATAETWGDYGYTYSLELVDPPTELPDDTGTDADDDGVVGGNNSGEKGAACGCAAPGGTATVFWLLAGLGLAGRRRR